MRKCLLNRNRAWTGAADHGAFTLTELVIVLAIIGLLVSILFPVFSRVRERARAANCASNLHQIGLGFIQYTQDNDGMMPPDGGYVYGIPNQPGAYAVGLTTYIQPYIKNQQILHCPDDPIQDSTGSSLLTNGDYTDYAYNFYLGSVSGPAVKGQVCNAAGNDCESVANSESVVVVPSATVAATDGMPYAASTVAFGPVFGQGFDGGGWYCVDTNNPAQPHIYSIPAMRHSGGADYLLCDGHVKWVQPQYVGTGWSSRWPTWGESMTVKSGTAAQVPAASSQNLGSYQVTFSPD